MFEVAAAMIESVAMRGGGANVLHAGTFVLLFFMLKRMDSHNKSITKIDKDLSFIKGKLEGISQHETTV